MLDDAATLHADHGRGVREPALVVRAHQEELLRAAYLLTGEAERAARLALAASRAQLRPLLRAEDDSAWRSRLLAELATRYLHEPSAALSAPLGPTLSGEPVRYQVEDERTRMWAALARCDRRQRLALVLRDFNGLDEETAGGLVQRPPAELRGGLITARERLREAAGARADQSAQALLLTLALGAPRVDLWAELAEPARRMAEQERRRRRLITAGFVAALLLMLVGGGIWLAGGVLGGGDGSALAALPTATDGPVNTPTPRPTATPTVPAIVRPAASVPDVQMIGYYSPQDEEGRQFAGTIFYEPGSGPLTTLDNLNYLSEISPDGAHLVFLRFDADQETGRPVGSRLVSVDPATGEIRWERAVSAMSARPAIFNDRIIGFHFDPAVDSAPRLVSYDLRDGSELTSVTLDAPELTVNWTDNSLVVLFASLDQTQLYVAFNENSPFGSVSDIVLLTFDVPELELAEVVETEYEPHDPNAANYFDFWGARLTPDGMALYTHGYGDQNGLLRFFDLATGELSALELPRPPALPGDEPAGFAAHHFTLSHDGRSLYIVSNERDVTIVDLIERRVIQTLPLDTGDFAFSFPAHDGVTRLWGNETSLLAPDGRLMYLIDIWTGSGGPPTDAEQSSTIWTVDVTEWRIVERWDVPGVVNAASLSADGSRLYLGTTFIESQAMAQTGWRYELLELDTATGMARRIDEDLLPAEQSGLWVGSLQQLYRSKYGVTPASDGVVPQHVSEFTSLPNVELEVSDDLPAAGRQVRFTISFLHPLTGVPVTGTMLGVRYDPSATVTLTLAREGAADVIVVPLEVEEAIFEAALPLEQHGAWQATVTVRQPDGTSWSRQWPAAVQVTPAFEASDGKLYQFRLAATPDQPLIESPAALQVVLVEIESGARLPEGVEFEGGLPEQIDVSFSRADGAIKSTTLHPSGHGVYDGDTTFLWAGHWSAELRFRVPGDDGPPVHVSGGTLEVMRP